MASGALDLKPLISHRFPIEQATQAYELLAGKEPYLGILLTYKKNEDTESGPPENTVLLGKGLHPAHGGPGSPVVGFIGAGNYAGRVLIPAFKKAGADLHCLASAGGVSGAHFGRKFGFSETTTDVSNLFESERVDTIVVATRHDSHAGFVLRSLEAGKNVFVEKPLCLNLDELKEIEEPLLENGKPGPITHGNGWFQPAFCSPGSKDKGTPGWNQAAKIIHHDR